MDLIVNIKAKYPQLSTSHKRIADFIMQNPERTKFMSSTEMAKQTDVVQSTIIKFVQRIGFNTFSEFKRVLISTRTAGSKEAPYIAEVNPTGTLEETCQSITEKTIASLQATMKFLDYQALYTSIKLIEEAPVLMVAGMGSSGIVAKDFAHKLLKIGKTTLYDSDIHVSYQVASAFPDTLVCVLISYSGKTPEMVKLASILKRAGKKIILITSDKNSQVAKFAEQVLEIVADEGLYRLSAMSSRIIQMSLIDMIYMNLVKDEFTEAIDSIDKGRIAVGWQK